MRLDHFSDNAHLLTDQQLQEIGNPDIIFYPVPKVKWEHQESIAIMRKNIELLNPKLVILAHRLVPNHIPSPENTEVFNKFYVEYFKQNASTNIGYRDEESFMELSYMTESVYKFTKESGGKLIYNTVLEITKEDLLHYNKPTPVFFMQMVSNFAI